MLDKLYSSPYHCIEIVYDTNYDKIHIISYADIDEGRLDVLSSSKPAGMYGGLERDEFVEEYRSALKKYWDYIKGEPDFIEFCIDREIKYFKRSKMYKDYEECE